jgi:hypothetical protein
MEYDAGSPSSRSRLLRCTSAADEVLRDHAGEDPQKRPFAAR